ncbi:MAG: hypothetical protein DMF64_06690 [Acidobacteria bacterium]|nr:MAG: hypothetical protein DMF64_06690 [Acidobacteriota bacterium]
MAKDTKRRTKTKALPKKERKLTAKELKKVRGGETLTPVNSPFDIQQEVTVNKPKTQDKAFQAFDGYVRG